MADARYPQGIDSAMGLPTTHHDLNKGFSSEFPEGYWVQQKAPEQGQRVQWPKHYEYSNLQCVEKNNT